IIQRSPNVAHPPLLLLRRQSTSLDHRPIDLIDAIETMLQGFVTDIEDCHRDRSVGKTDRDAHSHRAGTDYCGRPYGPRPCGLRQAWNDSRAAFGKEHMHGGAAFDRRLRAI